jgi:hypothetical protein
MDDFKFEEWCTSRELEASTKAWLIANGFNSRSALEGLVRDDVHIGDAGVANAGERAKILGGVKWLTKGSPHILHIDPANRTE